MTDPTPDERPRDPAALGDESVGSVGEEPAEPMPKWLPLLIGGILVVLAGLAVYTGLQYRERTLTSHLGEPKQQQQRSANAPSGEPGAGSSLVLGGETPSASEPVPGESRTMISGGREGVQTISRTRARRGMLLKITPADALVYVNSLPVGQAQQFNSADEAYEFPESGSYTVRIVAPNGIERTFLVTTADDAYYDLATIEADLSLKKP